MTGSLTTKFENFADNCKRLCLHPAVGFSVVLFFTLVAVFRGFPADPDLFARVAVGKLFFETGFQLTDPFSFAPKKEIWVDHEWLAGLVFFLVSKSGDLALLIVKCLFVAGTLYFLFQASRLHSSKGTALILCTIAGLESTYLWATTIRSQVFTYIFLAYLLWGIIKFLKYQKLRYLFFLPLCMLVWIQAHGGFVVGLGLFGIFAIWTFTYHRDSRFQIATLSLFVLIAATISPYGTITYWDYILKAISMERPAIGEWNPIEPFSVFAVALYVLTAFIALGFCLKTKNKDDILSMIFLVISAYFGVKHQRLAAIYCFVVATLGSTYIEAVISEIKTQRFLNTVTRSSAVAVIILLPLSIFFVFFKVLSFSTLNYDMYPVKAMSWLENNASGGNLLVDFNNGSFALWRGYPKFLVSMDGRYEEVYFDSTLPLVTDALDPSSSNHTDAMKTLSPDYILYDYRHSADLPNYGSVWQKVYHDESFALFSKEPVAETVALQSMDTLVSNIWKREGW